tara:strand:+ start:288 stop:473 length:186 start_codon:yes stop_codon:yes gene_type:complete
MRLQVVQRTACNQGEAATEPVAQGMKRRRQFVRDIDRTRLGGYAYQSAIEIEEKRNIALLQ